MIWIPIKRKYCRWQHFVHSEPCSSSSSNLMSPYQRLVLPLVSDTVAHSIL